MNNSLAFISVFPSVFRCEFCSYWSALTFKCCCYCVELLNCNGKITIPEKLSLRSFRRISSLFSWKVKGFGDCPEVNFVQKNWLPWKQYTSSPVVRLKCCCLPGILRKHTKLVTFFVETIRENPRHFFSN